MRILYGYSNCTDKTYNRIVSERNVPTMVPDQKYHSLMIKGFSQNGAEVRAFSGLPVNRAVTARKLVREKDEKEGNASFHYITTLNYPGVRQLMIFFGAFFGIMRTKKDKDTFAVCDGLNAAIAAAFSFACRLRGIPCVAIVTDLPDMFDSGRLRKKVSNFLLGRFDGYVFLTEHMNEYLGKNKPYIVLEGHVDPTVCDPNPKASYEEQTGEKVVLYAGNIQTKYGIRTLAEGFALADIPDAILRVYGDGDDKEQLKKLSENHPNILYMGRIGNEEIVREEQKVSLLVNPRPSAPDYTKYSFPSKNMEYMVSGTPTLTTKLPGMPEEYYPYVYLLEDESPEGVAVKLREIFSTSFEERKQKAFSARRFVIENKSNIVQSRKILDFLQATFGNK